MGGRRAVEGNSKPCKPFGPTQYTLQLQLVVSYQQEAVLCHMDHPVFLARSPTPSQLFSPRVTLSESRVVTQPWQQQPPAVATSAMQQQQVSMTLDMGCNNLLQIWHWWSNWMFKRKLKYYLWYKILMDQPKRGS